MEEGTNIVALEAMKMQNPLFAPMTGKIGMCLLLVYISTLQLNYIQSVHVQPRS